MRRTHRTWLRAAALAVTVLPLACARFGDRPAAPAPAAGTADAKDEMRMPWEPASAGYLRTWLLVGEFPNPPHAGTAVYDHTPPCVGLDTDYLKARGGESAVRPTAGMTHARPDGSVAAWTRHASPDDIIDLQKAFADRPTQNAVAYGFATFDSPKGGEAVLAVGSDDGVRVWLNGRVVHTVLAARGVRLDEDLVPVTLKAGENTLLVKVENGSGGWGFALRVLGREQAGALTGGEISPVLVDEKAADVLAVRTDGVLPPAGAAAPAVKVEVVAAGGRVVAAQDAPRGQTVRLAPKDWPDGPYEVRCTTTTPAGRPDVKHLPWYKGDAVAAARRVVESAARADPATPHGMVHRMLAEMILDRAGGSLDGAGVTWQRVHSPLMEFAELGGDGAVRPGGFVRLAYRDEVDGSPQFCRAYLPPGYDPARSWPLVVNLHGYNPPNPPYVRWWGVDQRHVRWADQAGVLWIEPHGRGNTSYRGIGEKDVLRCVDLAKARFRVDPDRVYLMGYSMGGGGTWHVGTRHTDVFAAIAPIYGGWDYHTRLDADALARLTPRERLRAERKSSFASAEQLLSTPLFVNHGDADVLVDVAHSRYAVRMLQRWGYPVRYWEHPGKGHGALGCEPATMEWFLSHRREPSPPKVRVRSPDLAGARAHWLAVTARRDPMAMILAEAEILGPNRVRLDTENALEVALAPGGPLIDPARPLTVVWNGHDVRTEAMKDGRLVLRAAGYAPGPLAKKPGLEGPLGTATETPFAIVVGTTSPDPLMRRLCARLAERRARNWEKWQHARPRVFRDTDLAEADRARYTLLLIGGPEENAVTQALAPRLPVKIVGQGVLLDGRPFLTPDSAISLVYPHPLNADRAVVLTAATSAKGMFFADRMPEDYDFAIVDGRAADAAAGRPDEKVRPAAGWFDPAWRVRDEFLESGDPIVRMKCPVRKVPTRVTAAADGPRLWLSDLLEADAEGSFALMERDLNWQARPLRMGGRTFARGLAVQVWHEPCAAEWDLEGGGWTRLRATVGIEIEDLAKLEPKHKENTRVLFVVKGDGRELARSGPFRWDSSPRELDVDVTGVRRLRLEVANETTWFCAATSVNWADARLEK